MRAARSCTDIGNVPRRILTVFALILMAGLIPACSKPAPEAAVTTPPPEVAFPPQNRGPAAAGPPEAAPAATPGAIPPPPMAPPQTSDERPPTPGQLQSAYLAARDTADRIEIVYQLGNADSADAMNVLTRLFQTEADPQLQQEMLDAADRIDGQLPALLTLLGLALGPSRPPDVRDAALSMLLGINDRRAIPNWQALLADREPDTRELARQQIEDLQLHPPE